MIDNNRKPSTPAAVALKYDGKYAPTIAATGTYELAEEIISELMTKISPSAERIVEVHTIVDNEFIFDFNELDQDSITKIIELVRNEFNEKITLKAKD
jgi:type III secretion system FlhB-like substrate exporter